MTCLSVADLRLKFLFLDETLTVEQPLGNALFVFVLELKLKSKLKLMMMMMMMMMMTMKIFPEKHSIGSIHASVSEFD